MKNIWYGFKFFAYCVGWAMVILAPATLLLIAICLQWHTALVLSACGLVSILYLFYWLGEMFGDDV